MELLKFSESNSTDAAPITCAFPSALIASTSEFAAILVIAPT